MKHKVFYSTLMLASALAFSTLAQEKKMASPAATAEGTIDGVKIKIDYHQPSAKGRKIMGGLVPYGDVWRTGANETTTIDLGGPAKIEGKDLAKGKYAIFTVPGEAGWTVIINKTIKWGAYDYKEAEDVLRVKVKPTKTASFVETFNISVSNDQVVMQWENTQVAFKVSKGM